MKAHQTQRLKRSELAQHGANVAYVDRNTYFFAANSSPGDGDPDAAPQSLAVALANETDSEGLDVRKLWICLAVAAVFVPSASAARWTAAQAATRLKATYTTVDPKAAAAIQEHIDALVQGGASPDDPLIVALRSDLAKAQHAAKVTTARCAGVGKKAGRYSKFHCTARLLGTDRTPPDRQFYTATVKLTVNIARGFGVKPGWR